MLTKVRWNNDDRGILNLYEADKWYSAARKWNSILKRRTNEYWFQLTPGRIVGKSSKYASTISCNSD